MGRIDRVQDEVRGITVEAMVAQRKIHHEGDGSRWGAVRKHVWEELFVKGGRSHVAVPAKRLVPEYVHRRHHSARQGWHQHLWGHSTSADFRQPPSVTQFTWPRPAPIGSLSQPISAARPAAETRATTPGRAANDVTLNWPSRPRHPPSASHRRLLTSASSPGIHPIPIRGIELSADGARFVPRASLIS